MDKNRQETAIDWLESKFQKFLLYYEGNHKAEPYTIQELSNDFAQAKQMEREQRINAQMDMYHHINGMDYGMDYFITRDAALKYAEDYSTRLQNETN